MIPSLKSLTMVLLNLIMAQLLQSMDQQPVHAQAYVNDIVLLAQGQDLNILHNSIIAFLALANGLTYSHS